MVLALLLSAVAVVLPAQQVLAADEEWEIVIPFTTSSALGEHSDLTFGCKVGATDGFDAFDTTFPNPFDPTAPYAAFTYAPGSYLKKDFRAPVGATAGSTRQWSLYTFSPTGTTKTLTWGDVASILPLDVSLTMTGSGQTINMRTQSSVNLPAGTHTLTITVTRLAAPSTVWVDDNWSAANDGDIVGNGYIFGYNAFDTIQGGIDAVTSPGTVNVLPGSYAAFTITEDDIQVIGQDGANVTGGCTIDHANGVTIQNLSFTGTVLCDVTDDTSLIGLSVTGSGGGNGINVNGAEATVTIDNASISGFANGINVEYDTAIITNSTISSCTNGIRAADGADVSLTGSEVYSCTNGVYLPGASQVEVSGCCSIHDNQWGFWVGDNAMLTANGNNMYSNSAYGVYWTGSGTVPNCEENWWGDEEGPVVAGPAISPRDSINNASILYSPWLDAPCNQGGDPVGVSAKFKAAPRTGEPGQKVQFTDQSTPAPGCTVEEWLWNFGDGSTSTEQNPSHVYNREGAFNVTLTVWDSCGFEQTITMKAYITIKKPTASTTVEPAKLGVSYLNIDPAQVLPNQEVTISANICNSGEERGTKTVSLMVNGEAVASQSVGVSGGSCQQVAFKTSRAVPGTYQVAIDGMTGEFSVLAPRTVTRDVPSQQQTGLGTAGIIAIIAVILVLIAALILVFKRD
jgi:PKD repeat protein